MDMATLVPWIITAVGGAVGGNILGGLTRGGGGVAGRSIIGALGGVGLSYAAAQFPAIAGIAAHWSNLMPNDPAMSANVANGITGAIGGGLLGLVAGLLIRPRN